VEWWIVDGDAEMFEKKTKKVNAAGIRRCSNGSQGGVEEEEEQSRRRRR
jgi:hypothetical protein